METRLGETRLRVTRAAGRHTDRRPRSPAYLSRNRQRRRGGTGSGVQPRRHNGTPPAIGPGGRRAPWGSCADRNPGGPRGGAAPPPPSRGCRRATPSPSPQAVSRLRRPRCGARQGPGGGGQWARLAARAGGHRFERKTGSQSSLPSPSTLGRATGQGWAATATPGALGRPEEERTPRGQQKGSGG